MDYSKHYSALISRAKTRVLEGYVERHHIKPKCLGGTDDIDNLVALTAREHFIAHLLLMKLYPLEPRLVYAVRMMCVSNDQQNRSDNRTYEWLKVKYIKTITGVKRGPYKKESKPRTPRAKETKPRNRVYIRTAEQSARAHATRKLNGYTHSEETKQKIRESNIKTKSQQTIVAWNKGLTTKKD